MSFSPIRYISKQVLYNLKAIFFMKYKESIIIFFAKTTMEP